MIKDTLYAKYISEREGQLIIENEFGFLTYKIIQNECFIANMFIDERFRLEGKARELIEELKIKAREAGCDLITGNIDLRARDSSQTTLSALMVGFKVIGGENGILLIALKVRGG